jgi:hypothetical protein
VIHLPKKRIRLFRYILSGLVFIWSFFLVQTNSVTQVFFNEDSTTLYNCIQYNPFSTNCSWGDYGFGIAVITFLIIFPLAIIVFHGALKKSTVSTIDDEWKQTNKVNFAILLICGFLFVYYVVTSANKWIATPDPPLEKTIDINDDYFKETSLDRGTFW